MLTTPLRRVLAATVAVVAVVVVTVALAVTATRNVNARGSPATAPTPTATRTATQTPTQTPSTAPTVAPVPADRDTVPPATSGTPDVARPATPATPRALDAARPGMPGSRPSARPAKPPAARPEPHPATQMGFLTAVRVTDDTVRLTIDRVLWLTGEEARRANHGVEPENGYVIVNQNRRLRTYRLDANAQLLGGDQLGSDGDGSQVEEITTPQLVERATAAIARGTPPLVNLWHEDSEDTTVVRLVEQYRP
jgi:hypothetical protein